MPNALIVGASRGIGLGLAREFASRGWNVTATVRNAAGAPEVAKLAEASDGKLRIETVDTADVTSGEALRSRLGDDTFDLILVNAGFGGPTGKNPRTVSHDEFAHLFVTNALGRFAWPSCWPSRYGSRLVS